MPALHRRDFNRQNKKAVGLVHPTACVTVSIQNYRGKKAHSLKRLESVLSVIPATSVSFELICQSMFSNESIPIFGGLSMYRRAVIPPFAYAANLCYTVPPRMKRIISIFRGACVVAAISISRQPCEVWKPRLHCPTLLRRYFPPL